MENEEGKDFMQPGAVIIDPIPCASLQSNDKSSHEQGGRIEQKLEDFRNR